MLIYGRNPVREAFRAGKTAEKIFFVKGERDARLSALFSEAKEKGVPVEYVERAVMDKLTGGGNHQGVAARVTDFSYSSLDDILSIAESRGEKLLVVLLDGITDPHNLGAIVRSAECFGAHGIVIPARRSVGVTDTVVKVSSGATEHMAIAKVTNLNDAIRELKERNVWVYACDFGGEAGSAPSHAGALRRRHHHPGEGEDQFPQRFRGGGSGALRGGEAARMTDGKRMTDGELALAAQRGDAAAEEELVRRFEPLAEGVSRSYILAGCDADDLRQIARIALLEAVRTYDPARGAEFSTYASACVKNRMRDAARSAAAGKNAPLNSGVSIDDERAEEGGVALGELVSPELSPEQQYIEKEAEAAFFEALKELIGERDLTVVRLYLASMPYKEISEKLGISAKKVDNTIYSAKKKIARLIADIKKD